MRTTAILNLKGGVGKTTTAINLAAILAARGYRVLLADADSQCNTTEFFDIQAGKNMATVLRIPVQETDRAGAFLSPTRFEGLDLLPADESLMDLDLSRVRQKDVYIYSLRRLLMNCRTEYDYVIIDCPPAFNAACAAALIAADDVVIPIKLDAFSLRGMTNLMRQVQNMRRINEQLKIAGVLPTMWYPCQQSEDAVKQLKKARLRVFHHIRLSKKADTMTWEQDPIIVCSPRSAVAVDYRRFVAEYVGNTPQVREGGGTDGSI